MTLCDYGFERGRVRAIDGDDVMRLVDMGLVGAEFRIRAKKRGALLIDFFGESWQFSAVVDQRVAKKILVEGLL